MNGLIFQVMAANEQGGHLYDNKVYPLLILHSLVSLSLWGVKNEKWGFGILISKGSTSADLSFLIVFFFRANMEVGVSRDTVSKVLVFVFSFYGMI